MRYPVAMTRVLILAALVFIVNARAAQPLVGTWLLERQELSGTTTSFEPLTLRISQAGDNFTFAFSVPVNKVHFVSMSYTVRLDGAEADVKNGQGEKIGTIKMTKVGGSQYNLTLSGPKRPQTSGKLTVSADGKHLTSESEHLVQVFSRP